MLTLHADLTTAQQSASVTPYITIRMVSRDGATVRTYTTADSPNRILKVQQLDSATGEGGLVTGGVPYTFSTVIVLRDHDNSLGGLEYRGMRVDIGWGCNTASGNRSSYDVGGSPPSIILQQKRVSKQGELLVELYAVSLWQFISFKHTNKTATAAIRTWLRTHKVVQILMETVSGDFPSAVLFYDDSAATYTDQTADAADIGASDVELLPAVPAASDITYFGHSAKFNCITLDMAVAANGSTSYVWEYWNGSSWSTLSGVAGDGATFLSTGGPLVIFFEMSSVSNWATTTINGQGPFYYIRKRITSTTAMIVPVASLVTVSTYTGLTLDTRSAGDLTNQGSEDLPLLQTELEINDAQLTRDLLDITLMGMRTRQDGFHLLYIDNAQSSPDYTYDLSTHDFYESVANKEVIVPNTFIYANNPIGPLGTQFNNSANDATSVAAIDAITIIKVDATIQSNAEALTYAERAVKRALRDAVQGFVVAPMNCGQEVWDLVRVVDSRTGVTTNGRVGQLTRNFEPGKYEIHIELGGISSTSLETFSWQYPFEGLNDINLEQNKFQQSSRAETRRMQEAVKSAEYQRLQLIRPQLPGRPRIPPGLREE